MSRLFDAGEAAPIKESKFEDGTAFGKKKPVEQVAESAPQSHCPVETASTIQIQKSKVLIPDEQLRVFLNRLADLLVQPSEKFPPQERALLDDLAARVTTMVSNGNLVALSERLISHRSLPPALVRALLHQTENVATPILDSQLRLSDSDLISVVKSKGEAHQLAIAKREGLSAGVCDAIVSHGNDAALRLMLRNSTARISRPAYILLSQRSLTDPSLLDHLIERESFPADIAHLVFWWCKSKERKRIIERFSCQRDAIREIIPVEVLEGLREQGGGASYAARMIQKPERMPKDDVVKALVALEQGQSDQVLELLSDGAGIKQETVAQILDDSGGEAIAVLAKSCGFGRKKFLNLRALLCDLKDVEWDEDHAQNDIATIIHDTLSTDRADVVLRYWDRTSREVTD